MMAENIDISETVNKISSNLSSYISVTPEVKLSSGDIESENEDENCKYTTQPLSISRFRSRVATFSPGLWSLRRLSPLTCARYGWMLLEKEVLQCVSCRAIVCTHLPSCGNTTAYDSFVEELGKKLVSGHVDGCGWQFNPSPDYFSHPPNIHTRDHLKNFSNNARSLSSLEHSLPYVNNEDLCSKWGIDLEDLSNVFGSKEKLTSQEITASLLSLCGWTSSKKNYLECSLCQRSIGLWSYCSHVDYKEELEKLQQELNIQDDNVTSEEKSEDSSKKENCSSSKNLENTSSSSSTTSTDATNDQAAAAQSTEATVQEAGESESSASNDSSIHSEAQNKSDAPISEEANKDPESIAASDPVSSSSETTTSPTLKQDNGSEAVAAEDNNSADDSNESTTRTSTNINDKDTADTPSEDNVRILSFKNNLLNAPEDSSADKQIKTGCKRSNPDNEDLTTIQTSKKQCSDENNIIKDNILKKNKRFFEPIEEHRHWCGWVVERTLTSDLNDLYYDDLRGFKVLMNQIKAYLRPSPSELINIREKNNTEGIRAVRSLLNVWASCAE